MVITDSIYIQLLEKFKKIKVQPFWPDEDQMDEIRKKGDEFVPFILYMCENFKPNSNAEKKSLSMMRDFLSEQLEFEDEDWNKDPHKVMAEATISEFPSKSTTPD